MFDSFNAIVHSIIGDKNKGWQAELRCPYLLCPSNQPTPGARPAKMKFVEKIQPQVYQYRCRDCHCLLNVSLETSADGRETYTINPALWGGRPSYNLNWRR